MPQLTRHYAHWPSGVPHTLEVPDRNLVAHLAVNAGRYPDKAAFEYYGRQTSYHALYAAAKAMAGYLQQHLGVRSGDRVLLMMQSCPQFAIAYHAILHSDAVVVALNPMSTAEEVAYYAGDSGGRVLITMQDLLPKAQSLLDDGSLDGCIVGAYAEFAGDAGDMPYMQVPAFVHEPYRQQSHARVHDFSGALAAGIAPRPSLAGGADLAVIAYTSGTTGKPKGAMLSHRAFTYAVTQRALWQRDQPGHTELLVLPISHLAGMNIMNQALSVGRTTVLLSRWDADAAVELIERHRINYWCAVTPMVVELLSCPGLPHRDLSSLKRVIGGATAMPEAVAAEVERCLGLPFIESYGMTESCGGTHINPPQAPRRQCGGIPYINVDARVIDPDNGMELGPGQAGEIVMHAPTLFDGYWNKPEATREAFIELDGKRFLRSGDIGYHDDDGYFYVTDRLKRMINAAGLKVWPAEIESWLFGHPAVQEACVISAYDPHRGETVKAFVVLRPSARGNLQPEQLIEWARSRMAAYKVPRLVEFVDSLPKTSTGKLLWRVLQDEQHERDRVGATSSRASSGVDIADIGHSRGAAMEIPVTPAERRPER